MRAPIILALLAVVATNSVKTSTLVLADTPSVTLATSASQPSKTKSVRSADTTTAQLAEERGKSPGLEEATRELVLREHIPNFLKPRAASFKKSGQSGLSGDDNVQLIKDKLRSLQKRVSRGMVVPNALERPSNDKMEQQIFAWLDSDMSESMVIAGMTPESGTYANGEKARVKDIINKWETHYDPKLYARIGAFVMDGANINDILRALQPLDRALSEPKRQRYTRIFSNWLEIDNKAKELYKLPMTEEYLWKVINEELKQNEGFAKFFGQWRLAYGKSIKENLATWLMQGKKKEEVEELLKDRRFIPQEYVNNRDLNKFVEMSNDPERYISDQLVEWLETSLPIEAVAAKLKTSLRSVNYATKFYFEYMIFFRAKSLNLDHTKALYTIKALVNMLLHAYR